MKCRVLEMILANYCKRRNADEHKRRVTTDAFNNPLFQIWHDMMMARTIQAIDAAAPDHTKAVMWAKTQRSVLFEMGRDFNAMIQHSERRYAELQHENSAAAKQEAKLDTQGFGLDFQARGQ